jgi:sugar phosphate isomerase/epimerase
MPTEINNLSKLCVHTITTKPLAFQSACEMYAKAGIKGITIWRDAISGISPEEVKKILVDNDLNLVSYCRGGFYPHIDKAKRQEAIADNKKMILEAAEIGAPLIVLVCGAHPGQSLEDSRKQIKDGIEETLALAEKHNIKLAIEPLHPMYADDRSAINTLEQANDMAEDINSPFVGVAVDVYHLWWDPDLRTQIIRCGKNNNLLAFHICDWLTPTRHLLLDRGLMGDGCINIKQIRGWVEEAGFDGFNEVEIFSESWWSEDQGKFIDKIVQAYLNHS